MSRRIGTSRRIGNRAFVAALVVVIGGLGVAGWALFNQNGTTVVSAPPTTSGSPSHTSGTSPTSPPTKAPPTSAPAPPPRPSGIALGIDTPPTNDANAIAELGRTPAIIDGFFGWSNPDGSMNPFPQGFVDSVVQRGSTPMITWTPGKSWYGPKAVAAAQPDFSLTNISSGMFDSYIRSWAEAAKADKHTVYVRLMHEMNGRWYPWGAGVNGNTPSEYVAAFQHVVRIFQQVGASNVQFVWCVATGSSGSAVQSSISSYFPGDSYVSWVAMDGTTGSRMIHGRSSRSSAAPMPR